MEEEAVSQSMKPTPIETYYIANINTYYKFDEEIYCFVCKLFLKSVYGQLFLIVTKCGNDKDQPEFIVHFGSFSLDDNRYNAMVDGIDECPIFFNLPPSLVNFDGKSVADFCR